MKDFLSEVRLKVRLAILRGRLFFLRLKWRAVSRLEQQAIRFLRSRPSPYLVVRRENLDELRDGLHAGRLSGDTWSAIHQALADPEAGPAFRRLLR